MTQTEDHPQTETAERSAICDRCHGKVHRTRRSTLAQVLAVHAVTCPANKR